MQFGGATVADVDRDGFFDLILTFHNGPPMQLYYGTASGRFIRSPFTLKSDIHGVSVAPRTALSPERIMSVSVGGGRGANLRPPLVYLIQPNRTITFVTDQLGFSQDAGRGRVSVFMDMSLQSPFRQRKNLGGPDVLYVNLLGGNDKLRQFAYRNVQGNYSLTSVPGFSKANEERAIVTDVDSDGTMEVVQFSVLKIFKLVAPFTFRDVTRAVWRNTQSISRTVSSVVELDFNNDGKMDLYIARANSSLVTLRGPPSFPEIADILLMNAGGRYVDVSMKAGIPTDTNSMAVTAEDFNNDGYVDVYVTTFTGPDLILLNKGDGSFERFDSPVAKPESTRGANVMAVDYDADGRVDFLVGRGWRQVYFGTYRLMRNQMQLTASANYLHVRVGDEQTLATTSLNAIVKVSLPNGQTLTRRVGGRGAESGGQSYIDTVHFGVGSFTTLPAVTVRWTTGAEERKTGVRVNRMVTFGIYN